MRHVVLIAFVFCIAAPPAWFAKLVAADAVSVDPALPALIAKLGDDDFDRREEAEKQILKLVANREEIFALVLKELTANEQDPEIRKRLEKLYKKLSAFGELDWSVTAGEIFQLPAIYNQRVFVGNKDGNLNCYEAANGKLVWQHENGGFIYKSLAAAAGRVIFIRTRKDGRNDGRVFALDALDGHELWSWQDDVRSQTFTAPIIADGAIYVGRLNELLCLDALQGTLRWSVKTPNSIVAPPAVAEGRVFFTQYGSVLQCVDAKDGKLIWGFAPETQLQAGACVDSGRVYVAGGNTVFRLDLKSGQKLWESSASGTIDVTLAVKGDRVYAAHGEMLRCINATDGQTVWSKQTGGHLYASPAVVGNRVYVGSLNNKLTMYCLNATDGNELWTHTTREAGYAEPIIVGSRLFIGYHSKFYCLKTGMPGPSAWPMSGGNPGRTGCVDALP